jgi:prephenate dehydratase
MPGKAGKQMKVAFQGELGAFSQQAIGQILGAKATPAPCARFEEMFDALAARRVSAAVAPIENTLHGSVHQNYDLLLQHDFVITAETNVRVMLNLIAAPGTGFARVTQAYSHPVALDQCQEFFRRHKRIESVPFYDTAGSVKMLMHDRPRGAAAIASELAAKIYGARILKREIEDDRRNYTRFFLLEPRGASARQPKGSREKPWKTSLVFSTRNVAGALFRALAALALRDLNLTKLESRPLRGRPWEYMFYLDLIGRQTDEPVRKALGHLGEVADFLRVLGSYRAA